MAPPHDDLIPKNRTDTNTAAVLRLSRELIAGSGDPLWAMPIDFQGGRFLTQPFFVAQGRTIFCQWRRSETAWGGARFRDVPVEREQE